MNVKLSDSNNDNNNNNNNSLWFIINFERSYFDCTGDNGSLKGALSGLRQFLATECPLKSKSGALSGLRQFLATESPLKSKSSSSSQDI